VKRTSAATVGTLAATSRRQRQQQLKKQMLAQWTTLCCVRESAVMSQPSSPLHRHAPHLSSPVPRHSALQNPDPYPPNRSPLAAFANTPCTSLTQADAAVVLETALLWVRPDHSLAVVHAGALAMQSACARLLAIDHGYLENLFSDANR
jgi:hypothetical protein